MNRTLLFTLLGLSYLLNVFCQQKVAKTVSNDSFLGNEVINPSKIIKSTMVDTVLLKLEVKDAHYNLHKNNLPFYVVSKTTDYDQNASAILVVKQTQIVAEPHASTIKKYLATYLTSNFEINAQSSLCKTQNLNHYTIVPFRLNNLNQVEELIDYDINFGFYINYFER